MPGDVRRRWSEADGVSEVMRPANKCNGMTYDADGNLLVCEHSTSSLVRERPDGERETIASHFRGKELNSPNDVITRSDGTIYFSDPLVRADAGVRRRARRRARLPGRLQAPGRRRRPRARRRRDEFEMPNGLCFSPDESLLYINDTPNARIRVYDVAADGSLSNGRVFPDGIGDGVIENGVVDGMKCDERGNVWVSGPGGVWVFTRPASTSA